MQDKSSGSRINDGGTAMSDKQKVKIALAQAITTQLWVKGLITQKQRETIDENSKRVLSKPEC